MSFQKNETKPIGNSLFLTVLGDIVVSLEKVYEESLIQGIHFYNHLTHMIIHSLLHLLGFDHDTKNFELMKKRNFYSFKKMSISSPYK